MFKGDLYKFVHGNYRRSLPLCHHFAYRGTQGTPVVHFFTALIDIGDLTATNARVGTTTLPMSTIPTDAVTFEPLVAVLEPGARTPVVLSLDAPAGQPSGQYTGVVTVTTNAVAQVLPVQLIVNQTPTINAPLTVTARAGQTFTVTVGASDLDQEPILLHAEALPDGDMEALSNFVDNGDGTATFTVTPDASLVGAIVSVPFIASNVSPFDANALDSLAFPPFVPHTVQEIQIQVVSQNGIYLPLIRK